MAHVHSAACSCSWEAKEQEVDLGDSLYPSIDTTQVRALNADPPDSAAYAFKPHDQRLSTERWLRSDNDDGELILHIPFTAQVVLKSFCVIGGHGNQQRDSAPAHCKMWINREDIDFSNASDITPTQEFDLQYDPTGEIEYPTRINKFQNVANLCIFFDKNYRPADEEDELFTQINFLGLKGQATENRRGVVKNVVYETRANIADHPEASNKEMAGSRPGM
jgi:hypothetical protein